VACSPARLKRVIGEAVTVASMRATTVTTIAMITDAIVAIAIFGSATWS
jgi:hypothetical protein